MDLSETLTQLRQEARLTRADVLARTGIPITTLFGYESGSKSPANGPKGRANLALLLELYSVPLRDRLAIANEMTGIIGPAVSLVEQIEALEVACLRLRADMDTLLLQQPVPISTGELEVVWPDGPERSADEWMPDSPFTAAHRASIHEWLATPRRDSTEPERMDARARTAVRHLLDRVNLLEATR